MTTTEEFVARALAQESEEFRRELETHRRYERILEELVRRPHLTADEEMEKKKIQKLKLAGKDRMARMVLAYRRQHPELAVELERQRRGNP